MDTKRLVDVDCLNCGRCFTFEIDATRRRRVEYLDQDGQPLGSRLILPKSYAVPCPYCRIENMVHVP